MSAVPVLYLHGVGDDGSDRRWWNILQAAIPDLDGGPVVIAPAYSDLLLGPGDSRPWPQRTEPLDHAARESAERAFHIRQADLAATLRRAGSHVAVHDRYAGFGRVPDPIDAIGERIIMSTIFDVVTRYVGDRPRRLAVLERVLATVDGHNDLVIVAHSLGSLVALDLIQHLPAAVRVRLLVTAGSAIARRALPDEVLSLRHNFPHDRIGQWVNVYNPRDAVTRGRGIARRFPDAVDIAVASRLGDHNLSTLVADPGIGAVLAESVRRDPFAGGTTWATTVAPWPGIPMAAARDLATANLLDHCADEAEARAVSPATIARVRAARQLRLGRVERAMPDFLTGSQPGAVVGALRHSVSPADIPRLLDHLANVRPFDPIRVRLPADIVNRARAAAALDLGAPPSWFHDATRSAARRSWLRRASPA